MTAKTLIVTSLPTDTEHVWAAIRHASGIETDDWLADEHAVHEKAIHDWPRLLNTLAAINRKAAKGAGNHNAKELLTLLAEIANMSSEAYIEALEPGEQ